MIVSYLHKDWNDFYNNKIINWSNLFNRKLCYEEKNSNIFNDISEMDFPKTNNTNELSNNENESNENTEEKQDNKENENVR